MALVAQWGDGISPTAAQFAAIIYEHYNEPAFVVKREISNSLQYLEKHKDLQSLFVIRIVIFHYISRILKKNSGFLHAYINFFRVF